MVLTRRRLGALTAQADRLWAFALSAALAAACFYLVPRGGASLALLVPIVVVVTLRFGVLGAASAVLWSGLLALGLSLGGLGAAGHEIRAALFDLQLGLAVLPLAVLPIAAVLMDVPVMDGLSAVRELRRLEAASSSPRTPVLMLTAHALPEHRAASAAADADAHLTKPVTAPALLEALSRALAGEPLSCAA